MQFEKHQSSENKSNCPLNLTKAVTVAVFSVQPAHNLTVQQKGTRTALPAGPHAQQPCSNPLILELSESA